MARYLTIKAPAEGYVREKMSRFLAFAHHVASPEEALDIVGRYTNKYHDARHVCWAYMIGAERNVYRSSDNGEPSGTAGKPILGQINSFELSDIVVVVVRYFGGIKLGTPGLIAAYRAAAREALEAAEICEVRETDDITLLFPYPAMGAVMSTVKNLSDVEIVDRNFDNTCSLTLRIPRDISPQILSRLNSIDGVTM